MLIDVATQSVVNGVLMYWYPVELISLGIFLSPGWGSTGTLRNDIFVPYGNITVLKNRRAPDERLVGIPLERVLTAISSYK